ncbi:hypothetical protein ABLT31_36040 [Ammoniphilus sp. 3BR4]
MNSNQVKLRVQNWLDRYFPEYQKWEGKASLMTLHEFPIPQEIVSLGAWTILGRWKHEVKRAVGLK